MKLFIGNLSHQVTEEDLRIAIEAFGKVDSVKIITDRQTGQSRGFGFVEFSDRSEAQAAISGLNGTVLKGRPLKVDEARPRPGKMGGRGGGRKKSGFGSGPRGDGGSRRGPGGGYKRR